MHMWLAVVLWLVALSAQAAPPLGVEWNPVSASRLEAMRGGFVVPGLALSFGIERVVSVNGEVRAATSVRIPDVARITADQAAALAALQATQAVQIGADAIVSGHATGLLIRNAADGADIAARTTIDVGVGSLDLYRSGQLDAALLNAAVMARPMP